MFDNSADTQNLNDSVNKFYGKDSMLRFGDDLTEEILQYLTLEDKIRLECVSKQWQRLIYNKQYKICIFLKLYKKNILWLLMQKGRQSAEQVLESVLKKCPNITSVDLHSNHSKYE